MQCELLVFTILWGEGIVPIHSHQSSWWPMLSPILPLSGSLCVQITALTTSLQTNVPEKVSKVLFFLLEFPLHSP